jgi:transcription antitermination factor NusG
MPTKIFVGNIASDTTRESMLQLFQRYGCVTECDVLGNYGFVHMMMEDEAKRAILELNGCMLNGNRLNVEMSTANTQGKKKSAARFGTTKIFIGNIRDGTTSESLRELFECYGRVTEADVLSGFGFVHMENEQEAQQAIRSLNGHILNGNRINVEMSTSCTQGKMRERDGRGNRPAVGVRYDPYPVAVTTVAIPRRTEPGTYDTYAGAVAAGTSHAASISTYAAPPAVAPEPTYQLQAVAAYPRVSAATNDSFTARDLLDLYTANPAAFATYAAAAHNPLAMRQSMNLGSAPMAVGVAELPSSSYTFGPARTDFFEKRLGPGFGDMNLAPASSVDPFASLMGPLHDPSAVSRGFSTVRVATAGPPGVTFGAAPGTAVMRTARVPGIGTLQHLYAQFE